MKAGLVVALVGLASPAWSALLTEYFVVEKVQKLPQGWTESPKAVDRDNTKLPMSIAVRHDGVEALKKRLADISDPRHADYGKHLKRDQVRSLRIPPREKTDLVMRWLEEKGIVDASLKQDWVHFKATPQQAKTLFGADLGYYSYQGNPPVLRTREYGVPKGAIADAVQFVHPLANFVAPGNEREHARQLSGSGLGVRQPQEQTEPSPDNQLELGSDFEPLPTPEPDVEESPTDDPDGYTPAPEEESAGSPTDACLGGGVTPNCILELYNIKYTAPEGESPALYGVAGFLEQYVYHNDTKEFLSEFAPQIPDNFHTIPIELVNGGQDPQVMSKAGVEASLDVQYAIPLAHPSRFVYYSTGGRGDKLDQDGALFPPDRTDNEPYLEFLEHLLDKEDDEMPHVIAISYADDEQGVPREYALKVCDLFAALAARGVSVIVATGDGGARGVRYGNCLTNDGKYQKAMIASFPGTCPYVTAIGAVSDVLPAETAGYSTGGFSIYFDKPAFQDGIIEPYLTKLNGSLDGLFNQGGRAIPDISAIGSGFTIRYGGGPGSAMGTSASTPIIASMFSLINDARMRADKPALGWLNPMLYTQPVMDILEDVVRGESSGCSWDDGESPGGWPALEGWDAGTGLGVPSDFQELLKVFLEA